MKINFENNYKSIHLFNEINIPNFSVFVGKNGSGKTHILEGIKAGSIKADAILKEEITYFDLRNFLITNQKKITKRSLEDEKENAWNLVNQFKNQNLQDNKARIQTQITNHSRNNYKLQCLLETGIFLSEKKLSELDRNTFLSYANYDPDDYELLNSLSEICFDYHMKYIQSSLPVEHGGKGLTGSELDIIENKSPWHFINEMFESFGLPHRFKAPSFKAGDIIEIGNLEYQAKPIFDNFEIGFEDLSSGEKILCALAITVFQDQETTKFPKLLLLDEIDATLHPSMVKNLLSVIKNVFLKNNCNVILATHSPTTASLVNEDSIFEVKSGKISNKIDKISQSSAVDILSEGMMNLEKGITLFDQMSKKPLSVLTEGNNIDHIRKAISVLQPEMLEKIDFINGVEGSSGKNQLLTLFEFFKRVNHTNFVLFVLDWDQDTSSKTESNRTFVHSLLKNELNQLANKGIENIYPEKLFDGFIETKKDSLEREEKRFDYRRKKDFLSKILRLEDKEDFENYKILIEKINTILNTSTS